MTPHHTALLCTLTSIAALMCCMVLGWFMPALLAFITFIVFNEWRVNTK